jgi:hypothetical protein
MTRIPVTPAQTDFLLVEIVGRYDDSRERDEAAVAENLSDSLRISRERWIETAHLDALVRMMLDAVNAIDDAIEEAKKAHTPEACHRALAPIGGIDTIADARALHRAGENLLRKLYAAQHAARASAAPAV